MLQSRQILLRREDRSSSVPAYKDRPTDGTGSATQEVIEVKSPKVRVPRKRGAESPDFERKGSQRNQSRYMEVLEKVQITNDS